MSLAVLQKTHDSVDQAFKAKDNGMLEKEAKFLIMSLAEKLYQSFSHSVKFVKFNEMTFKKPTDDIYELYRSNLENAISALEKESMDLIETKMLLDKLFLNLTSDGYIEYEYESEELISVEEVAQELNVSRPTVYRYLEKGLEYKEVNGVKKIPKLSVNLWKNPAKAFELQFLYQENQLRMQSLEEKIAQISRKINYFECKYQGDFATLYADLSDEQIDTLDEAFDVSEWKYLIKEKRSLLEKLKGRN